MKVIVFLDFEYGEWFFGGGNGQKDVAFVEIKFDKFVFGKDVVSLLQECY